MIILKLVLIVGLCYLIGRGLARESEKAVEDANKKLKCVQGAAKDAYDLMEAERSGMINTINELREEVATLKKLNRRKSDQ